MMQAPTLDPLKTHAGAALKHEMQLTRCRFSPCGRFVAAGGLDARIHLWELQSQAKRALEGHTGWMSGLAFHPDGRRLFTADMHGTVHCWPYGEAKPRPLWTLRDTHSGWLRSLALGRGGELLATAGSDRVIRLWESGGGKLVKELPGHRGYVFSVEFHPDGTLVSGDLYGVVRHWDPARGTLLRELDAGALHTRKEDFLADVGGVRAMAFDAAGARFACSGLAEAESNTFCPGKPTVLLFDWAAGKVVRQHQVRDRVDGYVNAMRFLRDGTLAGCGEGSSGAGLWFWRPDQEEPFHSLRGETGYDLDLHPDGVRLAAALYENRGHTGNGRRARTREEYVPNMGQVKIYHLHQKA